MDHNKLRSKLIQQTSFAESSAVITLPTVKDENISIYEQYVKRATVYKLCAHYKNVIQFCNKNIFLQAGGSVPNPNDMNLYETYSAQYNKLLVEQTCSG